MKAVSGTELVKLLERQGWILSRVTGSHHILTMTGNPLRISVPVHGSQPLKIGLQRHLMKLAGIAESEL